MCDETMVLKNFESNYNAIIDIEDEDRFIVAWDVQDGKIIAFEKDRINSSVDKFLHTFKNRDELEEYILKQGYSNNSSTVIKKGGINMNEEIKRSYKCEYSFKKELTDIEIEGMKSIIKNRLYDMLLFDKKNDYTNILYPRDRNYYQGGEIIWFKLTEGRKIIMKTIEKNNFCGEIKYYVIYKPENKEEQIDIDIEELTYEYKEYKNRVDKTLELTREIFRNICKNADIKSLDDIRETAYYRDTKDGNYGEPDTRDNTNERLVVESKDRGTRYIEIIKSGSKIEIMLSGDTHSPRELVEVPIITEKETKDEIAEIKSICVRCLKMTINYVINGILSENLPE